MKVLVVGSGGREHALCWAIAASPLLSALWCAPGNPGIAAHATLVPIAAVDVTALVAFAVAREIDLVVPGPEAPLVAGLADALAAVGIRCCGPTAAAARLEASKSFCKEVAEAAGVATARWERFEDQAAAVAFVRRRGAPVVVKADGLAGGKGVVVAHTVDAAEAAIGAMMTERRFGASGAAVLIEECLEGPEVSVFALCDGTDAVCLGSARDHKRVGDGDTGPNTGGMGAFSPVAGFSAEAEAACMRGIVRPVLAEMAARGTPFRGILFAGLMLTAEGAKLIEFNVRLGDPEAQALLPRLACDLLAALLAACDGTLGLFALQWRAQACVAVVLAAPGYPGALALGTELHGLADAASDGALVFQGGTAIEQTTAGHDVLVSAGGRVLTVCGLGANIAAARQAAYAGIARIRFAGGFCRTDIARMTLNG